MYYSLNDYCKKTFGHKLYKLSLDGGMTCPNRDGTVGTGGCIFCTEKGSGEFCQKNEKDIVSQIEKAKKQVEHKNKNGKYIAYFQSYTNTYAPVNYLEDIFTKAINHPDIEVLSIATRPDCINKEVLNLLKNLNRIKPVWVELGLQTSKPESIRYIRRGYGNSVYEKTVKNLKSADINVITHIILGLPGETESDMLASVEFAVKTGTDGLKLHMLYIDKNAGIYTDYLNGKVPVFKKDDYINLICDIIPRIPENVVIHRLTGDGDKKTLVAPLWSANKKDVLNSLNGQLKLKNIIQGEKNESGILHTGL